MSKKILIFSTAYFPFIGGAEIAVKEITDRISDIQFDMVTARIDRKLPKNEKVGNINVYRIGIGIPFIDKYYLAFFGHKFAQKLHTKNNFNAIWSIMASYSGFTALSFKEANPNIPFLLTLQEGDELEYINKRVSFLKNKFRKIFTKSDLIQTISFFLASWAKKMGASCPIEVVPNAVDIKHFSQSYSQDELLKLRESLNFKKEDVVLVTVSRLAKKNAVNDIISSLVFLPEQVKLLILGAGQEYENLKQLVKELKIEDRVNFLGFVDHKELPKYLKMSNIFVRPSLSEGLGNSFLEAMAAEIPVIATEVGGIPDFLINRETGFFCQVHDPKDISRKVLKYIKDIVLREEMIQKAKTMVQEKYDWNKVAMKMEEIFKKIT